MAGERAWLEPCENIGDDSEKRQRWERSEAGKAHCCQRQVITSARTLDLDITAGQSSAEGMR